MEDINLYDTYIEGPNGREKLTLEKLTRVMLDLLCGEWSRSAFREKINEYGVLREIRSYIDDLISKKVLKYQLLKNVKIDSGMASITSNRSYDFLYLLNDYVTFDDEKVFFRAFVEVFYRMGTKENERCCKIDHRSEMLLNYNETADVSIRINSQDFLPHLDRDKQSEFMKAIDEFWFVPCIKCNCFIFNEEGIKLVSQKILELLTKKYAEEPSETERINIIGETQAEQR